MKIAAPNRISRTYTQHWNAPPDEAFPLLCPVREVEWVRGWEPKLVLSESGVVEQDCVFTTAGVPQDSFWVVTDYDAKRRHLEVLKLIPDVVLAKIVIDLDPAGGGDRTTAEVSYTYTSLGPFGDRALEEFTEEHYVSFMKTWEAQMNHFLATGAMLEEDEA